MPAKLPLKFPSTRVKSPAPRPRPSPRPSYSPPRPPSSRRSRSYDPDRRPAAETSYGKYPPPARRSSRAGRQSPDRRRRSPERSNGRHRSRRDSSSDIERYARRVDRDYLQDGRGRQRPSSLATRRDERPPWERTASTGRYPSPPKVRPVAAPAAFYREGEYDPRREHRRSLTPEKYKPEGYKRLSNPPNGGRPRRSTTSGPAAPFQTRQDSPNLTPRPEPAQTPSPSSSSFLNHMPAAYATYAGLKSVTKHADTAKEWIGWLNDLNETPEEIQSMSAKATTARDTITQVQETLKARPDLVEGATGQQLKGQIEDAIANTDKALGKMTKLLSEISKSGADRGDMMNGFQDFWRSYRYKDEFEDKVKQADDELQKEMTALSTLMVNIYSRALMKPAAPTAGTTVPPPAPTTMEKEPVSPLSPTEMPPGHPAEDPSPEAETPTHPATTRTATDTPIQQVPKIIEPEPKRRQPAGASSLNGTNMPSPLRESTLVSPPPPTPGAVAEEEAAVGSPPMSAGVSRESMKDSSGLPTPPSSSSNRLRADSASPSDFPSQDQAEEALLDAAWDGDVDRTRYALRYASPRCSDLRGLTPLHLAAERDKLAVAMCLLDEGANIETRSDGGRTPLHLASRSASSAMVEMLIERGRADPDAQTAKGRTPLHYAASKAEDGDEERRDVIRMLRDWGADPTIVDVEGETARDVAQKRSHWDAASTLRRAERQWAEEHRPSWLQRHGFTK